MSLGRTSVGSAFGDLYTLLSCLVCVSPSRYGGRETPPPAGGWHPLSWRLLYSRTYKAVLYKQGSRYSIHTMIGTLHTGRYGTVVA